MLASARAADDCLLLPDDTPCSTRVSCSLISRLAGWFRRRPDPLKPASWTDSKAPVYSTDPNVRSFLPKAHRDSGGFLIAGVNSNDEIARASSLTGVSFEDLNLRAYSPNGDG